MEYIQFDMIEEHIARLMVNRPEVRNALHWEAMDEFSEVIQSLKDYSDIRVLLITGAGKAFISGADLDLVGSLTTRQQGERLSTVMGEALGELRKLPLISIAVIDGPARGGGAEIAISCDLRYMSESASIGFVQTSLGLIPGWGGASRLLALVGYPKGLEYLTTAKIIEANEAQRVGLVNGVFVDDELDSSVLSIARQVSSNSWDAVRTIKEMYLHWGSGGGGHRPIEERERFLQLWESEERREIFSKLNRGKGKK